MDTIWCLSSSEVRDLEQINSAPKHWVPGKGGENIQIWHENHTWSLGEGERGPGGRVGLKTESKHK